MKALFLRVIAVLLLATAGQTARSQTFLKSTIGEDSVFQRLFSEPEVRRSNAVYKRWSNGLDSLHIRITARPAAFGKMYELSGGYYQEDSTFFEDCADTYYYDPVTDTFFIQDLYDHKPVTFEEYRRLAKKHSRLSFGGKVLSIFGTHCK